jgi:hypothetical protein
VPFHDAKVTCDVLQVQLGLLGAFSARRYNSSCYKLSCAMFSVFGNRIITRGLCPLHLPDLNPCVSHFWGILKNKLYGNNPGHEYNQRESIFSGFWCPMNLFVRHVSADQVKIFTVPYLNVVNRNLILIAIQSTKTYTSSLMAKWNSSDRCAACSYIKWSQRGLTCVSR